jgi:hypothetical protein
MSIRFTAFLPLLVAFPLAACSSTSSPAGPAADAGPDATQPPNDSGPQADGGVDAPFDVPPAFIDGSTPEGGTPATPGMVKCGGTSCSTSTQFCCAPTTDAGAAATCDNKSDTSACMGGARQECDDGQDCPAGQYCCVILDQGPFALSTCSNDCISASAAYQACRVNGECLTGTPCNVYSCGPAGTWELCASVTPAQCH